MIKTMSIFENMYLVETDKEMCGDCAQDIVDEGTATYYQHHNGEIVKGWEVWESKDKAIDWLHENEYY